MKTIAVSSMGHTTRKKKRQSIKCFRTVLIPISPGKTPIKKVFAWEARLGERTPPAAFPRYLSNSSFMLMHSVSEHN